MKYNHFLLNFKWLIISLILLLLLTQCSSDDSISFGVPNANLSINKTADFDSTIDNDNVEQTLLNEFSESGKMVFVSARENGTNIFIVDLVEQSLTQITDVQNNPLNPKLSPDGSKVIYESSVGEVNRQNVELFVYSIDENKHKQLTFNNVYDGMASWSPIEDEIAFVSERDGNFEIYTMNIQNGNVSRITSNLALDLSPNWSPDGENIVFASSRDLPNGGASGIATDIYIMKPDGTEANRLTDFLMASTPVWSPDGTHIAFTSGLRYSNINIINIETSEITPLLNNEMHPYKSSDIWAEDYPSWSSDSKNIAFTISAPSHGSQIFATSIEFDEERVLFQITQDDYRNSQPDWFGQ